MAANTYTPILNTPWHCLSSNFTQDKTPFSHLFIFSFNFGNKVNISCFFFCSYILLLLMESLFKLRLMRWLSFKKISSKQRPPPSYQAVKYAWRRVSVHMCVLVRLISSLTSWLISPAFLLWDALIHPDSLIHPKIEWIFPFNSYYHTCAHGMEHVLFIHMLLRLVISSHYTVQLQRIMLNT